MESKKNVDNELRPSDSSIDSLGTSVEKSISPKWMWCSSDDILDGKNAEDDLKASELRYRRLFETAKDGILILDYDTGMIVDVNPFLMNLLNYTYQEFIKKHIWDIGIFKDIVASKAAFTELQKNSYVRYEDLPLSMDNGKKIDVEFVSNVYLVKDKKVIQCNIRDITDRKIVEKKLQETSNYLENLINSASVPIIVWDSSFKIRKFNNAFEKLTGKSKDDVIGKDLSIVFPEEETVKRIKLTMKGEIFESVEIPVLDSVGKERIILWNSANIYDDNKKLISTIAQGQDITERNKTRKEIEKSLKEKDILLEEVNHRVKNNLQLISSLLHLQQEKVNGETASILLDSRNRIKSIAIAHQILYQSKDFLQINVNQYMRELLKSILESYDVKKISVEFDIEEISLKINTVITCGLIVNELVTNVLKHAFQNKSGKILLSFKSKDDKLELTVKDNGIGIPDSFIIEKAKSLGLKLVKSLTEQLEGNMSYEINGGTTFRVTFPNK